ncbi:helix-turn-helix domain-containing protein [Candidatus Oscillochloris fontis]|uniref:helix-turn-helix domain-containing protein n=1 Tax=Candidatus Oscillochloris fontis TaxID=2496868 RepID=UPI00101B925C|nr:helix-turn-helix domain-containing protein [Candidatus Oscillochloris fontis]
MSELQTMRDVLTVDEVAEYLRVSRATVCRWCVQKRLPAFKIGKGWRVQRSDLEGYIRGGSVVRVGGE